MASCELTTYSASCGNGVKKIQLESVNIYSEDGKCYLDITYNVETARKTLKFNFPRVIIPVNPKAFTMRYQTSAGHEYFDLDIGVDCERYFKVEPDENGVFYTETVVKEKVEKLTLAQVEKRLGYKIEIVEE